MNQEEDKLNPHNRILSSEQASLEALNNEELETLKFTPVELLDSPNPEEEIQYSDSTMFTSVKGGTKKARDRKAELVYMLIASGNSNKKIAQSLEISPTTVSNYLKLQDAEERITYHRERLYGKSVKSRLEGLAHRALDTIEATIDGKDIKPETKFNAATYILDHTIGKAKQTVEHKGDLLGELMERINSGRVVSEIGNIIEAPKDSLDNFAEEFAPEHTVGVRNEKE